MDFLRTGERSKPCVVRTNPILVDQLQTGGFGYGATSDSKTAH